EILDDKAISEPNRQFLENWNQYKSFNLELSRCPRNRQITLGTKPELTDLINQEFTKVSCKL
ncbi:unnamed protein product, partial [Schistosoma rodhaini]